MTKQNQIELLHESLWLHQSLFANYLKLSKDDADFEVKAEEQKDCIEDTERMIEFLEGGTENEQ